MSQINKSMQNYFPNTNNVILTNLYFESDVNYNDKGKNAVLVNHIEKKIEAKTKKLLEKTAREFESDICLFAKNARKNFWTWQEWEKYDWSKKYRDAKFNIKVDMNIKMTGMIKQ